VVVFRSSLVDFKTIYFDRDSVFGEDNVPKVVSDLDIAVHGKSLTAQPLHQCSFGCAIGAYRCGGDEILSLRTKTPPNARSFQLLLSISA